MVRLRRQAAEKTEAAEHERRCQQDKEPYRRRIHVAIPDRWTVDARLVRAVAAWAGAAIIRPAKS